MSRLLIAFLAGIFFANVLALHADESSDAVAAEYRKIMLDDDAAQKDVEKWSANADSFAAAGAGASRITLNQKIQQRLAVVRKEYEDFLQRHPNHTDAHIAFGSFLNDTQDEEGAVAQWEKARALNPKDAAVWNNLANYYGHRGPITKAFEYYAKAIELDGHQSVYYHNLAILIYLYRPDASAYYHLTETQVFDKSLDLYREAIRLAPDDFVLFSDYAESFYGTKPPRLRDGLVAWTQALKIAHDDVEREGVYIHLARINLKLGNYAQSAQSLNVITNPVYAFLKNKISRNLKAAMSAPATNAPIPTKSENK